MNNADYDVILREFDALRFENTKELRRRKEKLYRDMPVLASIDEQIIHGSVKAAKMALSGNEYFLQNLERTNTQLILQKQALLENAGYPADYLSPIYRCPVCKDTGRTEHGMCRCFKQAIIDHYYMDPGRAELLERENFSTFDTSLYSTAIIDQSTGRSHYDLILDSLRKARLFAEKFPDTPKGLLISGESGVGKTFLVNCITKSLLDKCFTVMYLSSFRLFEIFTDYKFGDAEVKAGAVKAFDLILDCDLLVIDDLGVEQTSQPTLSQFFTCMEERALRGKPILITTNLGMEAIKQRYSGRVASRLFEFQYIKLLGFDNRIRRKMQ